MCDIMTIAGVALSGASAIANSSAASSAARARSSAMQAERTRQAGLQREAAAINEGSQDRYKDFDGQQQERSSQLGDYFAGQADRPMSSVADANTSAVMPTSGSNIVLAEQGRQQDKARAYSNQQAGALGELQSFGDLLGGISRAQGRDASRIGQIGGFMQGSSGVLPYELDAAAQKGAGAKMLGDLLGGAGSLATKAGLSGGTLRL